AVPGNQPVFCLIRRILHRLVQAHKSITASGKTAKHLVEAICIEVIRMNQQRLRDFASEDLWREALGKFSCRNGEVEISITYASCSRFVFVTPGQDINYIKDEIRILNCVWRDFVTTINQKLLDRFFLGLRIAGMGHGMAKVE